MTWKNKPAWEEGMFLRPQHFQQFERFTGAQLEARVSPLHAHGWGFASIEIERHELKQGKLRLTRCSGIFDDGTPFGISSDADDLPTIEIAPETRGQIVRLCLPTAREDSPDMLLEAQAGIEPRFMVRADKYQPADAVHGASPRTPIRVGRLQPRLRVGDAGLEDYATIPVARVIERRADGTVVLDEGFIPTVTTHQASTRLVSFVSEILGMLRQQSSAIAGRIATQSNASAANVADYGMLMLVNQAEASLRQLATLPVVHPGDLYRELAGLAGALATFTREAKRVDDKSILPYDHRAIAPCYESLLHELRWSLNYAGDPPAVPIPLTYDPGKAVWSGVIENPGLFDTCSFVLGAFSTAQPGQLEAYLPNLLRIDSRTEIGNQAGTQAGAAQIHQLRERPQAIPKYNDTLYFGIDTTSVGWQRVRTAQAVALHLSYKIPDLKFWLWAVRNDQ